jgi:hypothetical protein
MNKVKPTILQKRTLEIKRDNPDMPLGEAMREGGYSPKTSSHPKQNFIGLRGTATAIEKWREELRGSGLGEQKIKEKLQEWIDAQKIKTSLTEPDEIVPDYKTQIEAGKMVRKDLGIETDTPKFMVQQNFTKVLEDVRKKYPL